MSGVSNPILSWRCQAKIGKSICLDILICMKVEGECNPANSMTKVLSLKEIVVTDSFMGLDRDVRKCQKTEAYDYCKTWLYVDNLRKECGCLPLSLWLSEKVKV